jgi:DNA helicase-2/ATP-dependent DNA helicase PcrA
MSPKAPVLTGDAARAVRHRGSHLQIIASAGSGKTEVISQRVVDLLAEGVEPEAVVAFTFTEKAAASLKARIHARAAERLGEQVLGCLAPLYVGTIHAYCFRILQRYVPRYEAYDVLEDNRLIAFLTREGRSMHITELDERLFSSIHTFLVNADIVENELIPTRRLKEPFRSIYRDYLDRLDAFHALTFGQIIARTVEALEDPRLLKRVRSPLCHLIVDEYQDVNPAQERLIELLTGRRGVELCVVGDDDQAIYQWRGTDVRNIVEFTRRYRATRTFTISTNRRSRPEIIRTANRCSKRIEHRLPKQMRADRDAGDNEVVIWQADTEAAQARTIAQHIKSAHRRGYAYRDMAVLVRGRVSLGEILDALQAADIPVQPGGRTGLFLQPDAQQFGRVCAWLADHDWRPAPGESERVTTRSLLDQFTADFNLTRARRKALNVKLRALEDEVVAPTQRANLVKDFYDVLHVLGVDEWDIDDPDNVTRLGVLARCSQILADYESVRRRTRIDPNRPGELIGGQDRGTWHYKWLAIYVQNWAQGAYQDFDGEDSVDIDAVEVTTVHQAKGLEWPIVFVPSLSAKRFPTSRMGQQRATYFVPTSLFNPERYNGTLNDERRLFYVALTRARDQLLLSTYSRIRADGRNAGGSPLLGEIHLGTAPSLKRLPLPSAPDQPAADEEEPLEVTLSDLEMYDACGRSYRLRSLLGFQPTLAPELGYGRAVHHVLREVAEHVREKRRLPTKADLDRIFDREFYLPAANKAAHRELKANGRKLVDRYVQRHAAELEKLWEVERPFELRVSNALVAGRADVILDDSVDGPPRLTILDYKTRSDGDAAFDFQLQVYAAAGREEGLDVEGAFVHDLRSASRHAVDVSGPSVTAAQAEVVKLAAGIRQRKFPAKPGDQCRHCDVAPICSSRATVFRRRR